jgi:hypothetical protein
VTVSSHIVTEAPAFSVVADVAIVKGETPAADLTWLTFPDGTARRAVVHVIHDLPHLVVESAFGLGDGVWGTLAAGGLSRATRAATQRSAATQPSRPPAATQASQAAQAAQATQAAQVPRRHSRLRLVTGARLDEPGALSAAAVSAVLNRWGDGPDTPPGVRARLRCSGPDAAELAGRLDDETIRIAAAGVRRLYREWSALPPGGTLRLTWPLHASWLRLL